MTERGRTAPEEAIVADLHVHTTASDGALSLDGLSESARRANLAAVAVTDHDRPHPELVEPIVERDGLTLVHGIELRVRTEDGARVDLLGYGLERTSSLTELVDRLQQNRIERARTMIARVEDRTGIGLDLDVSTGIGRPHVARAIDRHPDCELDYQDAFDELIGDDRPCFVARDVPTVVEGRSVLGEACGLVGLAHPLRYDDPEAAIALCADLDAIERWYPYGRAIDPAPVERAIREYDLVPTGGSDAHDERVGRAGLSREAYRRFLRRGGFG